MRPIIDSATIDQLVTRWPRLAAHVAAHMSLAERQHDPIRRACRHLLAGEMAASACLLHPASPLVCPACLAQHVAATHNYDVEHRCDECRRVVRVISPAHLRVLAPSHVRGLDGRRRRLVAPIVTLAGIGLCPACWRRRAA
jgi:hypothetical protein